MIAWMIAAIVATGLLAIAATAADETARLLERPRRWTWLAAMAASLALPALFHFVRRPARAAESAALDPALFSTLLADSPRSARTVPWLTQLLRSEATDVLLLSLWAAAAVTMLLALLLTYRRLRRTRASAIPVTVAGIPALLTPRTGPMVIGVGRPEVVVPAWVEALPAEEQQMIVRHEWEHVRAGDTRVLLLGAVMLSAAPWNLPLWWMCRRLRQAVELDCDTRVLASGADRRTYGRMLIETAGRPGRAPFLAPALVELPSLLERRIDAMTRKSPHFRRARIVVATSAVALLAFAACEMTPRGGTPSPTEPTLADVVEPGRPEVSQRFVVEFSDSVTGPAEGTLLSPTGEVTIFRINETGDSTITGTLRLRESPLQDLEGEGAKPLYIVDGERVASLEGLDPARVLQVDVLKGPLAVQRFGGEGQDGVVQITTGDPGEGSMRRVRRIETAVAGGTHSAEAIEDVTALRLSPVEAGMEPLETRFFDPENPGARPLFFVDGEKVSSIEGLDPARIEKIEVLKGAAAAEYGPEGKDGVILVTTRR